MLLEQFPETSVFLFYFISFVSFAYFIDKWVCRDLHIVILEWSPCKLFKFLFSMISREYEVG